MLIHVVRKEKRDWKAIIDLIEEQAYKGLNINVESPHNNSGSTCDPVMYMYMNMLIKFSRDRKKKS